MKTRVEISDELRIARNDGKGEGESRSFTMELYDRFDGETHTIKLFNPEDAIALASELLLYARSVE